MLVRLIEFKVNLENGRALAGCSSFMVAIQFEVLSMNMQKPHFESYEGKTYPEDHLASFMNNIQFHNFSDAILCTIFSTTMKGVA